MKPEKGEVLGKVSQTKEKKEADQKLIKM